jgi:hypothetical protein
MKTEKVMEVRGIICHGLNLLLHGPRTQEFERLTAQSLQVQKNIKISISCNLFRSKIKITMLGTFELQKLLGFVRCFLLKKCV